MEKNIICTCCPLGCSITVQIQNGKVTDVSGYTCERGKKYAYDECTNPLRTLTTTVSTDNGERLSVKTASPIPFSLFSESLSKLSGLCVKTPVRIGQPVLHGICGTDTDVVATKNIP